MKQKSPGTCPGKNWYVSGKFLLRPLTVLGSIPNGIFPNLRQKEKLVESKELDIEFDVAQQYVYVNWKGFHSMESVKSGCEKLLQVLTEKNCKRVLDDNRMVSGPWLGAAEWVATDWFPRVYAAGVEKFAWIVSANIFSQMSTEATQARNKSNKTRTFDDIAKATQWLGIE